MNKAIPAFAKRSAERLDPMLARAGHAARQILRDIHRLPKSRRAMALDNVLASYDASLPQKVSYLADRFRAMGMSINMATERAVALGLADASIDKIRAIGAARIQGHPPVGLYGLGQATNGDTQPEADAKKKVGQMFQGIVCSDDVQSSVTNLVGRRKGAKANEATNVGYEIAQGFAQCSEAPTPPPPPPDDAPAEGDGKSVALPVGIGIGALVVVGGVVWYTKNRA